MTQTTITTRFIGLPMPELSLNTKAKNYVAIYDVVASEHSLISCTRDDLIDPAATMARFNQRVAGQIDDDRADIALESLSAIHHKYVAAPVLDDALMDRLRIGTYILTEIEQHPWFFIVRAPQGTSMFRVPVKNATQFHAWVYSKGRQAVLDIANELVAADAEGFMDLVVQHGESVTLH